MNPSIPASPAKVAAPQQQRVRPDLSTSWPSLVTPAATTPVNRLPVPDLRIDPVVEAEGFRYTVSTICCHGQLKDRAPVKLLGWLPGQRISLTVSGQSVAVAADSEGFAQIGPAGHLRLPAPVRHQCRIEAGDQLLVAVSLDNHFALVYTFAIIDIALSALHNEVRNFTR